MSPSGSSEDCLALTKPQRVAIYTAQVLLIKVCFPTYFSSGYLTGFLRTAALACLVLEDTKTKTGLLNPLWPARPEPSTFFRVLEHSPRASYG